MGDTGPGVGSLLRGVTGLFTCPVPGPSILAAVPSPRGVRCQQAGCFRCRGKRARCQRACLISRGRATLPRGWAPECGLCPIWQKGPGRLEPDAGSLSQDVTPWAPARSPRRGPEPAGGAVSPSKTAAEPAPLPGPAAGRTPRAGVRLLLLWGPCMQWRIPVLTLGLPCTRRPPTSLDSRTIPQRARFRPVWLQVYTGRVAVRRRPVCPLPSHNPASRLGGGQLGLSLEPRNPAEGLAVASPSAPLGPGPLGP